MVETKDLHEWAAQLNKPVEELQAELDRLYNSPLLQAIPNPENRTREALRVLKNRYYRGLMVAGLEAEFSVLVFRKSSVRKVQVERDGQQTELSVMNVFGIGKKEGTNTYQYMRISAWGDDVIKGVITFKPNTVYKVNLKEKGVNFSITQNTKWMMDKVLEKDVVLNLVRKILPSIPYTDYTQSAGNKKSYAIEGSIIRHFSSEREGRKFSMYGVKPSDMENIDDLITTQGLTVWLEPDMLKYGDDSLAVFIGSFGGKDGKSSMNCDAIIPIIEYPMEQEVSQTPNIPDDVFGASTPAHAPVVTDAPKTQKQAVKVTETPIPVEAKSVKSKEKKDGMFDNVKIVNSNDDDPFGL